MKLKNILRSRKAISPILATLLLVVIAVAAVVATYAWVTTYMGNTTNQAGILLYEANISFSGTETVIIDVGNSGTSAATISAIYAGESSSGMTQVTPTYASGSGTVNAGSTVSFNITMPWTANNVYYFKVVTTSGQPLQFSQKA
jgi:flagellin-like protein